MKVLVDMNLSPRWVEFLNYNGLEANHWLNCGNPAAADSEIMAYARENGFVVFTHDLDVSALLAASKHCSPSVIQIRATNLRPQRIGSAILAALRQMRCELAAGAMLSIDPKRSRIRLLPL